MANLDRVIPELAQRITGMIQDGAAEGLELTIACGFRPLDDQKRLYAAYEAYVRDPKHNPPAALAAIPGTSNHGKVVNGVQQDSTAVDLDVTPPTPYNLAKHLQLAERWGLYRAVPGEYWHLELDPHREPMPNQPQEEDDMIQYEWADGAIVCVDSSGNAFCPAYPGRPTAQHFGGMSDLRDDAKQSFSGKVVSVVGIDRNNSQLGYIMMDESWGANGERYQFDSSVGKFFK